MKTKEEIIGKYFSTLRGQLMQTPKIFSASDVQILSRNIEAKCLEFIEAYHEEKTRWISVEERLPEFGEPVFVWCRIYGRYIGTYQQIDGTRFGNWSDGKDLGVLPPLFWQPLPTPPKINAE